MNHMRHATAASPTMEAPGAMPPITLGLSEEGVTGSEELGASVSVLNIEVGLSVDIDGWAAAVVAEVKIVVGTNADVDATVVDVESGDVRVVRHKLDQGVREIQREIQLRL